MTEQFEVGEKVAVISGSYHRSVTIKSIDRETKLYWMVGNTKFRKDDGFSPGGSPYSMSSRIAKADDPAVIALLDEQWRHIKFVHLLNAVDQLRADRDNADAVRAVIDRAKEYLKRIE